MLGAEPEGSGRAAHSEDIRMATTRDSRDAHDRRDKHGSLGGRARRGGELAKLAARASKGLVAVKRAERSGDAERVAAAHDQVAEAVFTTLGEMKGAAMKLGQMLSFVDFDVDEPTTDVYRRRLAALQSAAPPTDTAAIEDVIAEDFGAPATEVFARWDRTPFAVASIGQVHTAALHSGEEVVVKVQHPGVAEAVTADFANVEAFLPVARVAAPHLDARPLMEELRERVLAELDYQQEAAFQQAFVDRYAGHPFVRVPAVHHDHCRPRVLVSERCHGRSFEEVVDGAEAAERDRLGEIIFRFVFGSLYRFRLFNADPHPGNVLFPDDGTVVFLDYGCSKAFSSAARTQLRAVHVAVAEADEGALLDAMRGAGLIPEQAGDVDLPTVLAWFRLAYEPLAEDAPYTYTREYARRLAAASSDPRAGYVDALRKLSMPADYVLLNRIQFGVNSLLARLAPTASWQRIMTELRDASAPLTPLGEEEAAWLHDNALLA